MKGATLPAAFTKWAVDPSHPYSIDPATISAKRTEWIKEWTNLVVRLTATTRAAVASRVGDPGADSSRCSSRGRSASIFAHSLRPGAIVDVLHRSGVAARRRGSRCGRPSSRRSLTLAVGLPAAYVVARFDFPGRRAFRAFVTSRSCCRRSWSRPRSSRCSDRVVRWRSCTGSAGVAPMLIAHVFFNVAVVVRTVGGFWANLDPRREEAARMLGASRTRAFRRSHAAAARAVDHRRRLDRVPVHVHVVRRRVAAGRTRPTPRSRSRSTARPSTSSTCGPRPRSRWCRSSPCSRSCSRSARAQERRGVAQRLVGSADSARRPRGREKFVVGGSPRAHDRVPRWPAGRVDLAFAPRRRRNGASTRIVRSDRAPRPARSSSRRGRRCATPSCSRRSPRSSRWWSAVWRRSPLQPARVGRRGAWTRSSCSRSARPRSRSASASCSRSQHVPQSVADWWLLVPIAHSVVAIPFVVRAVVPVLRSIDPRLA